MKHKVAFWVSAVILAWAVFVLVDWHLSSAYHPPSPTSEHICREEAWNAYTAGLLRDALETNPALRALAARRPPLPPVGFNCSL